MYEVLYVRSVYWAAVSLARGDARQATHLLDVCADQGHYVCMYVDGDGGLGR